MEINTEISGPVQISVDPGFYQNSITVELSTNSNTEQIYYTLDGSKPVSESSLYSGPIIIESTTVLKTRSIENGKLPGYINSSTYFISENSHIPTISLIAEPETLWDEEIGSKYSKTEEGKLAPLIRHHYGSKLPDQIILNSEPIFTPTFILLEENREKFRFEGYLGEEFFWSFLSEYLQKLKNKKNKD